MTDDRKLALALSDLTEEHLLAITHAMRSQRDKSRQQGNERLAEEQSDGHAVAESMAELVALVDAAETEARRSKR